LDFSLFKTKTKKTQPFGNQ